MGCRFDYIYDIYCHSLHYLFVFPKNDSKAVQERRQVDWP